jgi:murein endopeptidase
MPKGQPGGTADAQWGERRTMDVIQSVANKLVMGNQFTPFGVGNISLAGGGPFKGHDSHKDGLGIDVRPARTDQAPAPTDYRNPDHDRAATRRVIEAFQATGQAKTILFNDPELYNDPKLKGFVMPWKDHDNHFHVQLK